MNLDGSLNKYCVRVVACGNSQVHGQNYFETFSLALAADYDWEVHPVDVKTVFMHTPLEEDICMDIPKDVDSGHGTKGNCVKLQKALYGLKQASRAWNKIPVQFLKSLGFKQLVTDSFVFIS